MAYKAGKNGRLVVGSTTMAVRNWKATYKVDKLDTTSTTSGGNREYQGGLSVVDATVEAQWDATLYPFKATAPTILPGTTINLTLYVDTAGSATFQIPTFYVEEVEVDVEVEGIVKYTVKGSSSGTYTVVS